MEAFYDVIKKRARKSGRGLFWRPQISHRWSILSGKRVFNELASSPQAFTSSCGPIYANQVHHSPRRPWTNSLNHHPIVEIPHHRHIPIHAYYTEYANEAYAN